MLSCRQAPDLKMNLSGATHSPNQLVKPNPTLRKLYALSRSSHTSVLCLTLQECLSLQRRRCEGENCSAEKVLLAEKVQSVGDLWLFPGFRINVCSSRKQNELASVVISLICIGFVWQPSSDIAHRNMHLRHLLP